MLKWFLLIRNESRHGWSFGLAFWAQAKLRANIRLLNVQTHKIVTYGIKALVNVAYNFLINARFQWSIAQQQAPVHLCESNWNKAWKARVHCHARVVGQVC
jgi:hypothetical protein